MNNIRSAKSNASVIRSFDAAARTYDTASDVQRKVARELVLRASRQLVRPPKTILDLGCGAGHVTDVARQIWPEAKITALDAAPGMLKAFRDKFPGLTTLCADAANLEAIGTFDLILSSMMLHWLPEPTAAVTKWREFLAPGGKLNVAVPVEGSLVEWRDFLRAGGLSDGLWQFPPAGFVKSTCKKTEQKAFVVTYPDAWSFLQSLKRTGARNSPRSHRPESPAALRRLLASRDGSFKVTFQIAFLTL